MIYPYGMIKSKNPVGMNYFVNTVKTGSKQSKSKIP